MANVITGLDIGSAHIKGIVAIQKKDGTMSVLSVFKQPSAGFQKGVLVDSEEALTILSKLIRDIEKIGKGCAENIFVNINSEYIKARPSRGIAPVARADREIQQEDVDRVIHSAQALKLSPNHLVLHNIIKEFFVDDIGDIQNPVGVTGNRLEVSTLVIEAFAPHVQLLLKCLRKAGADVGGLIFNALASGQAVLTRRQKELGVLLIDFGFGTTSMIVYEENKILHGKSFPIGFRHLTNDIAIGLKIPIEIAEKVKLKYGYALARDVSRREMINLGEFDSSNTNEIPRRFLAEIIEIRLVELLDLINNELKSLGRNIQLPAGIVVTGGGVKLSGVTDLVRQVLKLPVQMGLPDLSGFEVPNPSHAEMIDDPEFSTAVGLVVLGKNGEKKTTGFLDPIIKVFKNIAP